MEHARATPAVGVAAPELTELVMAEGPFLTVYLTTEAGIDNAAQRSQQRWKSLRATAAEAGAPDRVLAAIDPLVPDAHLTGQCLAVIATGKGLVHVEQHPDPPPRDLVRWAPLPSIVPVLEWRQSSPPHVAVLTDRRGADLFGLRAATPNVHRSVDGDDDPLAKSAPGGWSQRRYQQRAENTWEHNADDVAAEVVRLAERVEARLVVAAGDVRALQMLQEALPGEVLDRFEVIGGGRSPDGSVDGIVADVDRLVEAAVTSDTEALLRRFGEELARADRAVQGVAPTLDALARAQVDVLLVHDDPEDDRRAWFGPEAAHVGRRPDELSLMGVDGAVEARLSDVAVRAALGTGASIRVITAERVTGGLGGLLRWGPSDEDT
jgi:hypothetical protein